MANLLPGRFVAILGSQHGGSDTDELAVPERRMLVLCEQDGRERPCLVEFDWEYKVIDK